MDERSGERDPTDRNLLAGNDIGAGTVIGEFNVIRDCVIGSDCRIWRFTNLYGATIGDGCMIGPFVEIQEDSHIGDGCRVQSHSFICSLVTVEGDAFISHGVKFVNDRFPPSGDPDSWESTTVSRGASIGTNATVLPVTIGEDALVGAGSVVVDDVPAGAVVAGNPAEVIEYRDE